MVSICNSVVIYSNERLPDVQLHRSVPITFCLVVVQLLNYEAVLFPINRQTQTFCYVWAYTWNAKLFVIGGNWACARVLSQQVDDVIVEFLSLLVRCTNLHRSRLWRVDVRLILSNSIWSVEGSWKETCSWTQCKVGIKREMAFLQVRSVACVQCTYPLTVGLRNG